MYISAQLRKLARTGRNIDCRSTFILPKVSREKQNSSCSTPTYSPDLTPGNFSLFPKI